MQEVFQMMLAYWSWLKKPSFWKRGDHRSKNKYIDSIRSMLLKLKHLWPRSSGNGWFKAKFHEQLHVPDDIERNGAPSNTHTGPTEHNHIIFVKNPAKRTQRRNMILDQQVAKRYAENYVIHAAYDAVQQFTINNTKEKNQHQSLFSTRNLLCVLDVYQLPNDQYNFCILKTTNSYLNVDSKIFGFFSMVINRMVQIPWEERTQQVSAVTVNVYTEYKRHETIFRSHPFYRSEQSWYDWVIVKWQENYPLNHQPELFQNPSLKYGDERTRNEFCYTPCKLVGFFYKVPTNEENIFEYFTVVWCAKYSCKTSSVFTNKWEMEFEDNRKTIPKLEIINCDAIVCHCCMIPENIFLQEENNNPTTFHELWPRELWGEQF